MEKLNADYTILLDVGTVPEKRAIYKLYRGLCLSLHFLFSTYSVYCREKKHLEFYVAVAAFRLKLCKSHLDACVCGVVAAKKSVLFLQYAHPIIASN